jgi:hypothetical protein
MGFREFWWQCLKWAYKDWEAKEPMIAYSVIVIISLLALVGVVLSISWQNYIYLFALIPFFFTLILVAPYQIYKRAEKNAKDRLEESENKRVRLETDLSLQIESLSSKLESLEERMKPQLTIDSLPTISWYGNRLGRCWKLPVKNNGLGDADDCKGELVEVASTIQGKDAGLSRWPHGNLIWNNGVESIVIAPTDTKELDVAYWEGYGSPLQLAYVKAENREHTLSSFNTPIILVISITSKSRPPIFCICKFHFNRLKIVGNEIVENDDNLEIIKVTTEKPDITLYQQQDSHNGDSQI